MVRTGNEKVIDLVVFGEILVKHYLHLRGREEKKNFIDEVLARFYVSPPTKFADEMLNFKQSIEGTSTVYNDALLFVMAVCADLIEPELYFDKFLTQYGKVIASFGKPDLLKVSLKKENHFECVFFAFRFFIDQIDLFAPPLTPPEVNDKKDEK